MTFDDKLKQAIDSLTVHLHDEISRKTQQISDDLAASAQAEREDAADAAVNQQEHLDEAVAEAARARRELDEALVESERQRQKFDDLTAENARQQQQVDDLTADTERQRQRFDDLTAENARQQHELEEAAAESARLRQELEAAASKAAAASPAETIVAPAIAAATASALGTGASAAQSATPERLVNAIRQIDDARTLSDTLDSLLNGASGEAERVAVLLVRGNRYTGWRSIGFDPPVERGAPVELPADASVIPLDIGGETVAVLRAERAGTTATNAGSGWPDPNLELL